MKHVNILFLGASKRVSLVERFLDAAKALGVTLNLLSCEISQEFYPISRYAAILAGPSFMSAKFRSWLHDAVREHKINVVIPNMDSATVALSKASARTSNFSNCWYVVSSKELCRDMEDKVLADRFFRQHGIPVAGNTPGRFPKIVKPRRGFGTKGVHIVESQPELDAAMRAGCAAEYIVQDFIEGRETTVDIYVSPQKGLIGYVLRDRHEVSDGEVMVCSTRQPERREKRLIDSIAALDGWCGCITLQYMRDLKDRLFVLEINPRFGGGATCAIEAGLDMPRYILSEYLQIDFSPPRRIKTLKMTRARRDFFCEL